MIYLPFHLPTFRQEIGPEVLLPSKDDPIRREPLPIDPRDLIAGLSQFRSRILLTTPFITSTPRGPASPLFHIGDIISGIGVCVVVLTEGMRCVRIKPLDPSDASGNPYGGVDLVHRMAGGFVDEDGSEGRVSSEPEIADTHRGCAGGGESIKAVRWLTLYWGSNSGCFIDSTLG